MRASERQGVRRKGRARARRRRSIRRPDAAQSRARLYTTQGCRCLARRSNRSKRAGDREKFRDLLQELGLKQPANGIARNVEDAARIAREIGYPVLVRPSFVLGGRAMEIVYDDAQLDRYMREAIDASTLANAPILIDKFLDNADECDVDCVADYDVTRCRAAASSSA